MTFSDLVIETQCSTTGFVSYRKAEFNLKAPLVVSHSSFINIHEPHK